MVRVLAAQTQNVNFLETGFTCLKYSYFIDIRCLVTKSYLPSKNRLFRFLRKQSRQIVYEKV
jgi:hypothetical protein